MDIKKIEKFIKSRKYPLYHINQIQRAVYKNYVDEWSKATSLPLQLREELSLKIPILSFSPSKILISGKSDAVKAALKLRDDLSVETVLLKLKPGHFSTCVSVQVGCAVGCPFCATGKTGLKRNLTAEEISDQILFWKQYINREGLEGDLKNIIFMGMGEPFFNYEAVKKTIKILNNRDLFNIGQRHISVSTFGYVPKITQFAKDFPQANLAISLHSVSDEIRQKLVPLSGKFKLEKLSTAIKNYLQITNRKIFIEYVLLSGINDSAKKAKKLALWLRNAAPAKYFAVNLIPCNSVSKSFSAPSPEKVKLFQNTLLDYNINATIRKSLGRDIKGACGQLAYKPF